MGWGALRLSPAIYETTGRTLDPKTLFDGSRLERSECVAKFLPNVTDDVTIRVKVRFFDNVSLLASPGKAAVSE